MRGDEDSGWIDDNISTNYALFSCSSHHLGFSPCNSSNDKHLRIIIDELFQKRAGSAVTSAEMTDKMTHAPSQSELVVVDCIEISRRSITFC
jgi:hypothetical protein